MQIWVMSKFYKDQHGNDTPYAYSYARNHSAMGCESNGWGLVWLALDAHQLVFLRQNIDPNVQVIGTERAAPTSLLLNTYADKLSAGAYQRMDDVLEALSHWEPRFILERDPNRP